MMLYKRLRLGPGVIAVVGGGGKTTLIERLAREMSERYRVLWTTTTHIRPPECTRLVSPSASEIKRAWHDTRLLAVGSEAGDGKWTEVSALTPLLPALADVVLVEADGSRGLPVKAPAEHEPVLPPACDVVIAVAGLSAIGQPIASTAHRPERYAALNGCSTNMPVTPERMARVLESPSGQRKGVCCRYVIALNQADTPAMREAGIACASLLQSEAWLLALKTAPDYAQGWRE